MPATESTRPASGLVPLVIGITGHRNIPAHAIPALERAVSLVFQELQESAPNTPLLLLSPLGEGADRLTARVALSMGIKVVAPLPLKRAEYASDFVGPSSTQEFDELIDRAEGWFVIEGGTEFPAGASGAARDRQYARVGAFVVRHSHLLLALWDGKPLTLEGGTAQVVEYKLQGIPEVLAESEELLDPPDVGPVYQIVTPRADGSAPAGEPFTVVRHFPSKQIREGSDASAFASEVAYIDRFNVDAANWQAAAPADADAALIMPGAPLDRVPTSVRQSLLAIEAVFRPADALARSFERRSRNATRVLFVLGLPAAMCLQGGSQGGLIGTAFLLAFLILLGAAFLVLVWMVKKPDVQSRYLDYRGLAEGLRIQYFWTLANTSDVVSRHYLRRYQDELGWVRRALQSCEIYQGSADSVTYDADLLRAINENWISDQLRWFTNRIHQVQAQILRIAETSYRLLMVGITFAVIAPAVRLRKELIAGGEHHWGVLLVILLPMIPVVIAMIHAGSQVRKLSRARSPIIDGEEPADPGAGGPALPSPGRRWKIVIPGLLSLGVIAFSLLLIRLAGSVTGPLNATTFLSLAFIFAAASLHAYIEKRGLSMHIKQYSRMARLFSAAHRAITQALQRDDHANATRLMVALGRESLEQNESWLLLHRERPIDIHGA